jgi:hypothetical protein
MPEVFHIVPAGGRTLWLVFVIVFVVMSGLLAMLVLTTRASQNATFEIHPNGLRLRGDLYGRFIDAGRLRLADARVVNLRQDTALAPARRTAGTAVPQYNAGWFKLHNGERALLYLTDRSRAVYVPTTAGYSLLLSPREPERFLERLRAVTGR